MLIGLLIVLVPDCNFYFLLYFLIAKLFHVAYVTFYCQDFQMISLYIEMETRMLSAAASDCYKSQWVNLP